jgi:hypothetical protein
VFGEEREKFVLLAHKNLIKPEDYAKNKSFIAPILAARKTGSTVAGGETLLMRLRGRWRSRIGDRNLFARELDFEYFFFSSFVSLCALLRAENAASRSPLVCFPMKADLTE